MTREHLVYDRAGLSCPRRSFSIQVLFRKGSVMLTISKLAVVGWDVAFTKWPVDECERMFESCGIRKDDDPAAWDKATWEFDVRQPGMKVVGKKNDGKDKLGVDKSYTVEQAVADAAEMFGVLGRDKYIRQTCIGFDLGARKDAPPLTTLKSGKVTDDAKAIWCLFGGMPKKETAGKTQEQLVAMYDTSHA